MGHRTTVVPSPPSLTVHYTHEAAKSAWLPNKLNKTTENSDQPFLNVRMNGTSDFFVMYIQINELRNKEIHFRSAKSE